MNLAPPRPVLTSLTLLVALGLPVVWLACTGKDTEENRITGINPSAFTTYTTVGGDPSFLTTGHWCRSNEALAVVANQRLEAWKDEGTTTGGTTVVSAALKKSGGLSGYTNEEGISDESPWRTQGSGLHTDFGNVACGYDVNSDGTYDSETESCEGAWKVMIEIEDNGSCSDPQNTVLAFDVSTIESSRLKDDTTCAAGSGRFVLVPGYRGDRDADGDEHGVYYAVLESGTGTMTSRAWITDIDVVDDDDMDVRVVHVDQPIRFSGADVLLNKSSISTALTGTHGFSSGVITGHPGFVLENIDSEAAPEVVVDMEWTCSDSGGLDWEGDAGFVLDLDSMGCGIEQKLVMRPTPHFLRFQIYGDPTHDKRIFTNVVSTGRAFNTEVLGVDVKGVLTSVSPTQATLQIDHIKLGSVELCTADTYTLPAL